MVADTTDRMDKRSKPGLLTRLFGRSRRSEARPAEVPSAPPAPMNPDGIVYAVGDIHGRNDLLVRLVRRIFADLEETGNGDKATLVFLGDYVDRGDQSREVIDTLCQLESELTAKTVFLAGNHEQAMIRFLDSPADSAHWFQFGGLQTLMSYGVRGPASAGFDDLMRVRDDLHAALGDHEDFLRNRLRQSYQSGNVFFSHAGIDPGRPLNAQDENTLLWGSRDFLRAGGPEGHWVVHGHYVNKAMVVGRNRIGVDTGAYFTGCLTAVRLAPGSYRAL